MHMKQIRTYSLMIIGFAMVFSAGAQTLSGDLIQNADIIVDMNGNGDYTTIREGIAAIPDNNDQWLVLLVRKGVYHEKLILNYKKTRVILVGEDVDSTIITWDDYGNELVYGGLRGDSIGGHTFSAYTFRADPNDFQAYNITFENTAGSAGQGVAFHSSGDRQILYHCRLLGYQDTYFDNFRTRRYMKDCFIEGRTDYIFGFGVTLFDSCQIHSSSGGYVTASATPQYYEFGHVFKNCRLTTPDNVTSGLSLGRPWFDYSNTIFYECWLPEAISPGGWSTWSGSRRDTTCIYYEYNNSGPGSDTTARVDFGHQLDPSRASRYNIDTIFAASNFPSDMGEVVDSLELWSMRNRFYESQYPARADTILYAGRESWPEYPTDNWSPAFYDTIYSIITEYTVPFMDSVNGDFALADFLYDGLPLEGFRTDSFEYAVEVPPGDTILPAFRGTGPGVVTLTDYPSGLPGFATVDLRSHDRVKGQQYKVYLSRDSVYWKAAAQYMILNYNYDDTIFIEHGKYEYEARLPEGDDRYRYLKVAVFPGQPLPKVQKPAAIPGDALITVVSVNQADTARYILTVLPAAVGIEEIQRGAMEILNPVCDRLLLKSDRSIPAGADFDIYDLNGRLVLTRRLAQVYEGISDISIETSALKNGFYIYRLRSGNFHSQGKFIKLSR